MVFVKLLFTVHDAALPKDTALRINSPVWEDRRVASQRTRRG
jgi:hypothetical protein